MYLRLWWKDARQFWPIWTFLILAAAGTQGLVLHYAEPGSRDGRILVVLALSWASLYAFAVGAAAFAGERENNTLRFLDILPASRSVVWVGKVSFAFVTTLALAGLLLAMAALGAESLRGPQGFEDPLLMMAGVLLHGLVLGLLLSSIMKNALLAVLTSMGLTAISWVAFMSRMDQGFRGPPDRIEVLNWYLGLTLASLIASYFAFTWTRRTRRVGLPIRFQSPIVLTESRSPGAGREGLRVQPLVATAMPVAAALPVPAGVVSPAAWTADRPRPRSRFTEFRHLMWQTRREVGRIWLYLFAIGLIVPAGLLFLSEARIPPTPFAFLNWLVALMAGVTVFGAENQGRTYRFLVHHGARPRTVWLAKLATWCIGLALIWVPLVALIILSERPFGPRLPTGEWPWVVLTLPLVFAVAQLCGMAIRRGITAGVIAVVVTLALGFAQGGLLMGNMMPLWGPLAIFLAFPVVTWAWSGDWLLDRPAPGRYLRLAMILIGTFGVLLGIYAADRAWSIADVGPIAPPSTWSAAPIPPDRNAADLYREAARLAEPLGPRLSISMTHADYLDLVRRMEETPKVLDLIRQAAARPDCQFQQMDRLTLLKPLDLPRMDKLERLVSHHARDRIRNGDLAGAWDDIVVLLRMARHLSESATMFQALQALGIEWSTLDLARDWATAPGQTPERLRSAIAAYRDLPGLIPAAEVVRGEAILFERTIKLPIDDLKGPLLETIVGPRRMRDASIPIWASLYIDMITTPWERERARRVNREYAAVLAREASLEPRQQHLGPGQAIAYDQQTAPLAKDLGANTGACLNAEGRNEALRRALVQVMAIRAWQLRHDGRFPDHLDELVPGDLPGLPNDPYSGKPFGYTTYARARQTSEFSARDALSALENLPTVNKLQPETRILYSVGMYFRDNPRVPALNNLAGYMVFPIPPIATPGPARPAASNPVAPQGRVDEKAQSKEPAKPAPAKPPTPAGSRP